eukprot:CAMPEP_0183326774 /NCGR_PEP_ID=MMETSP0160_2-20130417/83085_1 /TAXON_ID=2839 ORGANISM="Odontella Sinensis, Strain Grunow 1884" /NCGR_SAMPLE_ID=MMETSP0160_2 /ASSEMBLY_ACC=CAM_ASM_000250 /LENGTH=688 /DNA_ID=CAMNT_0025494831 /DNA_START=108 /DNA_END=2174 /DNA_ORIENTATION=+
MSDSTRECRNRPTSPTPTAGSRIRPRTPSALSPLALVFILLHNTPSTQGFSPSLSTQKDTTQTLSRRNYRADDADAVATGAEAAVNFLRYPTQEQTENRMPTWLRQPRGYMVEEAFATLREAMVSTYLSESEADTVLQAILTAANGDPDKVAGASEFCLIMVESMEMDKNALVAGAFHYCTCVTARERCAMFPPSTFSLSSFWDHHEANGHAETGIMPFGSHATRIAKNAARIKRTETLAASSDFYDAMDLRSLLLSETRDWRALAIRSAACLFRLRGLLASEEGSGGWRPRLSKEANVVAREALNIYAPLASQLGMHRLKNELEGAAFRILYRRQFHWVTSLGQQHMTHLSHKTFGESLQVVLDEVTKQVTDVLRDDATFCKYAEQFVVSARVKEPFSLWKKMLKTGTTNILDIPDSLALRVVLRGRKLSEDEDNEATLARDRALCYYVQRKCVDRFRPQGNGRFKDYIEQPKRNGYQSLHYTAQTYWEGQEWPFEVQVRSEDMHRVAEYGVAAHWSYKDQSSWPKNSSASKYQLDESLEAYLRSVQEYNARLEANTAAQQSVTEEFDFSTQNQSRAERVRARAEGIAPYIEALSAAQLDLTRENVFVFLQASPGQLTEKKSKILALPSGACVLDALREGEKRFGVHVDWRNRSQQGVTHNGIRSNVTQKLSNGDVVTIQNYGSLTM